MAATVGPLVRRPLLFGLVALASCSRGAEADLQYIGDARSVAAEWALVNEQADAGKLTSVYVRSMHQWLRDQARADSISLSRPNSSYGAEIAALLRQPDDADPATLRAYAGRLKRFEDTLEST